MSRRLVIGIASYGASDKLRRTLESIQRRTVSDWRCFVIDNPGPDPKTREVIAEFCAKDARFAAVLMPDNIGYAGAVNELFRRSDTDFVAYCDNDIRIETDGWDEKLIAPMRKDSDCGWVFPGSGHYGFQNGKGYRECLWNAGYCWVMRREAQDVVGEFDSELGHHEEVDYMIRMRLAGYLVGCVPEVQVIHDENSTRSPESAQRIHDGVVRWMNKWNGYFCGDQLEYAMDRYDARALRYTDWNACALYLERMTLHYFPEWNQTVEKVNVPGVGVMDAVKVLKPSGPYRGRAV